MAIGESHLLFRSELSLTGWCFSTLTRKADGIWILQKLVAKFTVEIFQPRLSNLDDRNITSSRKYLIQHD